MHWAPNTTSQRTSSTTVAFSQQTHVEKSDQNALAGHVCNTIVIVYRYFPCLQSVFIFPEAECDNQRPRDK